jgi:hypothetical protein
MIHVDYVTRRDSCPPQGPTEDLTAYRRRRRAHIFPSLLPLLLQPAEQERRLLAAKDLNGVLKFYLGVALMTGVSTAMIFGLERLIKTFSKI